MNPADAYPGDEYVDVIGMDFYYNIKWNPTDPVTGMERNGVAANTACNGWRNLPRPGRNQRRIRNGA